MRTRVVCWIRDTYDAYPAHNEREASGEGPLMRMAVLVSTDLAWAIELATTWRGQGDEVTIVLLDGAAAVARQGHAQAAAVGGALGLGLAVIAHDDALRRRAIRADRTLAGVKVVDLDEIADLVTEGAERVMWV